MSVSYIAPEELPNGVVGAGLKVATTFTIPGNAPSQVVWLFGRSLAVIDAAAGDTGVLPEVPADTPVESSPAPPASSVGAAPAAPMPVEVAASSGALSPSLGQPIRTAFGSLPAAPALDAGVSPAPEATPAAPAQVALAPAPRAASRPVSVSKGDDAGFYLLTVAGAAALFVLAQVLGALGVRGR